jgi:hypothetical protein
MNPGLFAWHRHRVGVEPGAWKAGIQPQRGARKRKKGEDGLEEEWTCDSIFAPGFFAAEMIGGFRRSKVGREKYLREGG